MSKIKLTESEFKSLIEKSVRKVIKEQESSDIYNSLKQRRGGKEFIDSVNTLLWDNNNDFQELCRVVTYIASTSVR